MRQTWGTESAVSGKTANDPSLFSLEEPAAETPPNKSVGGRLQKEIFSYFHGISAAGNPAQPLVVAPLIQGKTTFDPAFPGGRAVILFLDNSVRSFPIEKDGRVLIDGKDIFDPAQTFWNGKVPTIKWPQD